MKWSDKLFVAGRGSASETGAGSQRKSGLAEIMRTINLKGSIMKLFKQKESYISDQMRIYGDIETDANISIDGEMHGNVRAKKHVMLGASARFEGNIESDSAMICGYFKGRVTAKRMLEVKVPATIIGDLISDSVRVDSGVAIQGQIFAKSVERIEERPVAAPAAEDFDPSVK